MSNTVIAGILISGCNILGMALYAWTKRRQPRRVTLTAALIHRAMHKAGMDVGLEDKDTFRILSNARAWTSWVSLHRPAAAAFEKALAEVQERDAEDAV